MAHSCTLQPQAQKLLNNWILITQMIKLLSPGNSNTAKSTTTSWRVTTRQSPAPNPDSPHPFRSPTQHLAPHPPSTCPRTPTARARAQSSDKRQTHRKSWLHTMNTSFPSQTPSRRTFSLTCHQKALQGTEPLKKDATMCAKCWGCKKDEDVFA